MGNDRGQKKSEKHFFVRFLVQFSIKMRIGASRGALIIFEGCDRSGKTTQCQRMVKHLSETLPMVNDQPSTIMMRFPDRSTNIGKTINAYLGGKSNLDDHVVHLLFAANRWEMKKEMESALEQGQHVIVDRYSFSGIAFSSAKEGMPEYPSSVGMSIEWCKQPERGLPKPDLVCFLDVSPDEAAKRGGYGEERYEKKNFQARVRENYKKLFDDSYWRQINTDSKSQDEVFKEIKDAIEDVIKDTRKPVEPLWPIN